MFSKPSKNHTLKSWIGWGLLKNTGLMPRSIIDVRHNSDVVDVANHVTTSGKSAARLFFEQV